MLMKIILACAFGRKNENPLIKYRLNGVDTLLPLGQVISLNTPRVMNREFQLYLILFPELFTFYLSREDKEILFNARQVRAYIRSLIEERAKEMDGGKEGDLLGILLQDEEVFAHNYEMIIDECVTFFIAGSQTTANATSNLICYLLMNPQINQKLRSEFNAQLKHFNSDNLKNLAQELDMEKIDELHYLKLCFYESLRIEPPVNISSAFMLTEAQNIAGFNIRAGHMMLANIYQLHHNKDQWQRPDEFVPERFDPNSEFFLTPGGKIRNPMSFVPFLGGKRICVGKTFAEITFKILFPIIISAFDFEFVDEKDLTEKR